VLASAPLSGTAAASAEADAVYLRARSPRLSGVVARARHHATRAVLAMDAPIPEKVALLDELDSGWVALDAAIAARPRDEAAIRRAVPRRAGAPVRWLPDESAWTALVRDWDALDADAVAVGALAHARRLAPDGCPASLPLPRGEDAAALAWSPATCTLDWAGGTTVVHPRAPGRRVPPGQ
jgi:hypothetical protein